MAKGDVKLPWDDNVRVWDLRAKGKPIERIASKTGLTEYQAILKGRRPRHEPPRTGFPSMKGNTVNFLPYPTGWLFFCLATNQAAECPRTCGWNAAIGRGGTAHWAYCPASGRWSRSWQCGWEWTPTTGKRWFGEQP